MVKVDPGEPSYTGRVTRMLEMFIPIAGVTASTPPPLPSSFFFFSYLPWTWPLAGLWHSGGVCIEHVLEHSVFICSLFVDRMTFVVRVLAAILLGIMRRCWNGHLIAAVCSLATAVVIVPLQCWGSINTFLIHRISSHLLICLVFWWGSCTDTGSLGIMA